MWGGGKVKAAFSNDPFSAVCRAFRRLYPGITYRAQVTYSLRDENGATVYGQTTFPDGGGRAEILVSCEAPYQDIDWSDDDVWEFIHHYNIPYCGLYDDGCKRLGCIGCPLGGFAAQRREFARWPGKKKFYIGAFDKMLEARKMSGKTKHHGLWVDGEGVFRWWTGEGAKNDPNQMSINDFIDDVEE